MDRKTVSNYTSAYKLSGVRSASDTKSQRVKRRSVEQKDLRQNLVNRKRQIGLSPLQEGDTTLKDKSHLATTPRLPKGISSSELQIYGAPAPMTQDFKKMAHNFSM